MSKKSYTNAALEGFGETYTDAALRGYGDTYTSAALRGCGDTYTSAALRGMGKKKEVILMLQLMVEFLFKIELCNFKNKLVLVKWHMVGNDYVEKDCLHFFPLYR